MATEEEVAAISQRLEQLLRGDAVQEAMDLIASTHPADQADLYLRLEPDLRGSFLALLSAEGLADLLSYLEEDALAEVVERMPRATLARVLDEMENDIAVDILRGLAPADAARVLSNMATAAEISPLLPYPDESAGGLMTRGYVALHKEMTAAQAITYLRLRKPFAEEAYYLYVLDAENRLQGVVNLRQLIISDPEARIEEVMATEVVAVVPGTDQEEAARLIQRYRLRALPVVDEEGFLSGIITADDLIDVIQEEATEDMYQMVGLGGEETVLGSVPSAARRRIPWLLVNLLTAFVSALTVSAFENTIAKVAMLAAFMPVVAGHGGNTGTQAITLVVRGLALGEVRPADAWRVMWKETRFGLLHGAIAGALSAALAFALTRNEWLAAVVFCAMLGNIALAATVGSFLPLLMRRLGIDPALASAIWLTTFTDIMGFLILLGLGALLVERLA